MVMPIQTGFAVAIPGNHAGLVLPRSGLAAKHGITIANSPGLIDSGYRGEIIVLLQNRGDDIFAVSPGDRIAQLLVVPFAIFEKVVEVEELDSTERGASGFGSSGLR
jgi:dUTP pyrophosphatase